MCVLSCVRLLATPWTVAHQVPLSLAFPRQEYWSGLLFPPPGDLPDSGIKPESPASPVLTGIFFTTEPPGNPHSDVLGFNSKFLKEKSTNIKNVYIIYPFTTRSRCYCRPLRELIFGIWVHLLYLLLLVIILARRQWNYSEPLQPSPLCRCFIIQLISVHLICRWIKDWRQLYSLGGFQLKRIKSISIP